MTYNEIMRKVGKRISKKVYYFDNNQRVEIDDDEIKESKPFFNAQLIGTVMKGLNLELYQELPNVPIYLEITASYGSNTATKTFGPYYLKEKGTYNADSKTYSHSLYDNFITSMVDYKPITINYPTTVFSFFTQLCSECGFTTDISSLPNGSRTIESDIYDGINFTYRDVFDDIGKATGTLFKINGTIVQKCRLGTTIINIDDDILKNQNIDMGEHFGPINCVVLSRSGDTDNIYKRDETLTKWNEFKISDCQLMNDNNRSDYLNELYDALYGIEYDIYDCELIGYGGFEPLDKIHIESGNSVYNSYVFNNEEIFTQGYSESIFTELPEETTTDYTVSNTTDKKIKQAYIIVNKQENFIEQLVQNVGDNGQITAASIILAINNDTSSAKINADELNLNANDIINLIANNTINLSTKNIVIASNNFNVDANGNLRCTNANVSGTIVSSNATITGGTIGVISDNAFMILTSTDNTRQFLFKGQGIEANSTRGGNGRIFIGYEIQNSKDVPIISLTDPNHTYTTSIYSAYISTPEIMADNIQSGTVTLHSSTETRVNFSTQFINPPSVVITPITSRGGVIAPKVRSVDTDHFIAIIGGSGLDNIECSWIAISS